MARGDCSAARSCTPDLAHGAGRATRGSRVEAAIRWLLPEMMNRHGVGLMRMRPRHFLIGIAALSANAASAGNQGVPPSRWVLDNVTIVDTRTGRLAPRMSILIDGARIAAIGTTGRQSAWPTARRVDGRGAYVVPGFNDMHAHPLNPGSPPGALQLMLANGITGFRQMSGSPEMLAARRAGTLLAPDSPTLLALPGTILTPPLVAPTPDEVVAEIRLQKEQGADFVKVVNLPPPAFFAGLAEARRLKLPFLGHLPPAVDVRQASDAGMAAVEHLGPSDAILLGCSTDETAIRDELKASPPRPTTARPASADPNGIPERALANPVVANGPNVLTRIAHVLDTFSADRCRDLARRFAANLTWQEPTLIRLRTMEYGDQSRYIHDPNLRYLPASQIALWNSVAREFTERTTPDRRRTLDRLFTAQLRLVRLFDDVGVPMLAGSDYGGGWLVAGFSLHQEFDLLAEAGLPPLRILQMTTLNAARFLNREATMGTVEAGRDADLVLLAANPIASVKNLHRVSAVVHAGRYFPQKALAGLRDRVRREAATAESNSTKPETMTEPSH